MEITGLNLFTSMFLWMLLVMIIFPRLPLVYISNKDVGLGEWGKMFPIFNTLKSWRTWFKKSKVFLAYFNSNLWLSCLGNQCFNYCPFGLVPMFVGGERFNATVLSTNLPIVTQNLMTLNGGILIGNSFRPCFPKDHRNTRFGKYF